MADPSTNADPEFAGRVAIVTGSSSGIGETTARRLAALGATVVVNSSSSVEAGQAVADEIGGSYVQADISDQSQGRRLLDETIDRHGRLDVLVNNAGVSSAVPALDFDEDEFRREVEIDLVAPYALARAAGAWAIAAGHPLSIVNVGSVLGFVGGGKLRVPGYAAAKGGLHNLTRELASEWARKQVRVNAIAPGWFETEMNAEMFGDERSAAYMADGAPMGRAGIEGELDGALVLLASDASSFMTGAVVPIDGGWTAV